MVPRGNAARAGTAARDGNDPGRTSWSGSGVLPRVQREDLERQAGRVATECGRRGVTLHETVSEVGSGLNGNRPKLRKLLSDPDVTLLDVEHRDRLARFDAEHREAALAAHGRRVLVLETADMSDELVREVTEVLTSMCARRYGRRSAGKRADAAMAATEVRPR